MKIENSTFSDKSGSATSASVVPSASAASETSSVFSAAGAAVSVLPHAHNPATMVNASASETNFFLNIFFLLCV